MQNTYKSLLKQCAAVKICRLVIKLPPHLKEVSPNLSVYPSNAIQGQASGRAGLPPTTLLNVLFEYPHPVSGVKNVYSLLLPLGFGIRGVGSVCGGGGGGAAVVAEMSAAAGSFGQQIWNKY